MARIFQHEYDHLDGKLFHDRMAPPVLDSIRQQVRGPGRASQGALVVTGRWCGWVGSMHVVSHAPPYVSPTLLAGRPTAHCLFVQLVELEEEYLKEHPDAQIQRVQ